MRDLGPGFRRGDEHNRFAKRITRCLSPDRLSLDNLSLDNLSLDPDTTVWHTDHTNNTDGADPA